MSQSATTPKVDLDQRTKDELQPPCEFPAWDGCDKASELILGAICRACGPRPLRLLCLMHQDVYRCFGFTCMACGTVDRSPQFYHLEPLR